MIGPAQARTPVQRGLSSSDIVTGPASLPRARRGISTPVEWAVLPHLHVRLDAMDLQISDHGQKLEAPALLSQAAEYAREKLQAELGEIMVDIRTSIHDQLHAKIEAFASDVSLVEWSERTFELEEEVIEAFFNDTDFSMEIHVMPS